MAIIEVKKFCFNLWWLSWADCLILSLGLRSLPSQSLKLHDLRFENEWIWNASSVDLVSLRPPVLLIRGSYLFQATSSSLVLCGAELAPEQLAQQAFAADVCHLQMPHMKVGFKDAFAAPCHGQVLRVWGSNWQKARGEWTDKQKVEFQKFRPNLFPPSVSFQFRHCGRLWSR